MRSSNFFVFDEISGRTISLSLEKREIENLYVVECLSYLRFDSDIRNLLKQVFTDYDDAWEFYLSQIKMLTI